VFANGIGTPAVFAAGSALGLGGLSTALVLLALALIARRAASATVRRRSSDTCAYTIMPSFFYDDAGEMHCVCEDELDDDEELDHLDYAG
jgi:hypothetical protein